MKISYTGRHEQFTPKQRAKLEAKIQKLSKMMERKGEKEAHVILSNERFLHKVEITINAWDHSMVGIGADRDLVLERRRAGDECALGAAIRPGERRFHDHYCTVGRGRRRAR